MGGVTMGKDMVTAKYLSYQTVKRADYKEAVFSPAVVIKYRQFTKINHMGYIRDVD